MFFSVHQKDFGVRVCFEARSEIEGRIRSLFLMTALRGENAWDKKICLERLEAHQLGDAPFFSASYFADLDPLLPRLRAYLHAHATERGPALAAEHTDTQHTTIEKKYDAA